MIINIIVKKLYAHGSLKLKLISYKTKQCTKGGGAGGITLSNNVHLNLELNCPQVCLQEKIPSGQVSTKTLPKYIPIDLEIEH